MQGQPPLPPPNINPPRSAAEIRQVDEVLAPDYGQKGQDGPVTRELRKLYELEGQLTEEVYEQRRSREEAIRQLEAASEKLEAASAPRRGHRAGRGRSRAKPSR